MFTELTAAIGSVKTLADMLKLVNDASKQFDQAELKLKIVEMTGTLVQLNSELLELRRKLSEKESVVYREGLYWPKDQVDDKDRFNKDDPYCPRCFDVEGQLVHMRWGHAPNELGLAYVCLGCKTKVK